MSNDPQKLKALADNQIRSKIQEFNKRAKQQIYASQNPEQLIKWFIQQVLHYNPVNVPRISLLKQSLRLLNKYAQNNKFLNILFIQQQSIIQFILQSQHMIDMAYVLMSHLQHKKSLHLIQYSSKIMQAIHTKMTYFFQQKKQKLQHLLRVNYILSFIHFKSINPSQIYTKITQFQLQQLQEQVFIMFKFLIKPWLQKRTPRKYYYQLLVIVYWNMIIQDNTIEKQIIMVKLSEKIINYFCCGQSMRSDGFVNYNQTIRLIFDSLAVNYRKEDPFKFYGFALILNVFQDQLKKDQIRNWIEYKGTSLKSNQIQNIFRNTFHIGSNIFTFNLIEDFSHVLKQKKQYNILYHLYLSFIKKDFLDVVLPNETFLTKYFQILQFYVIGFLNKDRLDGQSQLDRLTYNLSSCLLRKKFNFRKHHNIVILFYKVYQARFLHLSSVSRRFLIDLQRFYRSNVNLMDIHNKIDKRIFREAGLSDQQNQFYEQLNIKRTDRYRGMMNLGNTCYMNSFMQALFMTKKFRSTILDIRDDKILSSDKIICYSLINLFTEMMTKNIYNDQEVQPYLFKSTTPGPFKNSSEQHDVAEFGRMYFEALTNQLNDDANRERIQKIFFNKINKIIKCLNCKKQKKSIELVFDFIVHLNKSDPSISVSKLLSQQFQGQQMSGDNQVYCQICKRKTNTWSLPRPQKFAQYLIITIGLFQYSGGGKKIKKPFNFQFTLNLTRILPNQSNILDQSSYQLYAFIVHIGNLSQSGHYICYARNLQQNPTIWYCFNDSYVTERQIEKVDDFKFAEEETPYMLFYSTSKRRKSISIN